MQLSTLTNEELTASLKSLVQVERETTLAVLLHLIELERRGLYRELGYGSLFDYCRRALGYSEGSAYRRIAAARCIREQPELGELFKQGEVTLCSIATAEKSLREAKTKPSELVGKSKREVEVLVAKHSPIKKTAEVVRPVYVKSPGLPLFAAKPVDTERYSLKFTLSKEDYECFQEVRARLSHSLGHELSLEAVFSRVLRQVVKKPRKTKKLKGSRTRYIPKAVKEEVYTSDLGQCSFVSDNGVRCCEKKYLHLDHVVSFHCGGTSDVGNLRLLCPAHNRLHAEQCFGKRNIERIVALTGGRTVSP